MLRRALCSATANTKVRVTFVMRDGATTKSVIGYVNDTLLDVAKDNDIDEMEGACGGGMACSTCHVILEDNHYTPPKEEDEEDMLDQAVGRCATSRLGCQIDLAKSMDGMTVRLPSSVVNQQQQQ